eukprot:scaffold3244_cov46-Phaeocystis_antarctica.AAC.2
MATMEQLNVMPPAERSQLVRCMQTPLRARAAALPALLYSACYTQRAIRSVLYPACDTQRAIRSVLHSPTHNSPTRWATSSIRTWSGSSASHWRPR